MHRLLILFMIALMAVAILSSTAYAGQFRVIPIRLFFDKNTKSGAIKVINEGTTPIKFQMEPTKWTQNAEGNDIYEETKELTFFPRIMILEAGKTRIIRTGVMFPVISDERTFRLYIRELPEKSQSDGVQVSIAVRFGVPIFVKPVDVRESGEITSMDIKDGKLLLHISNKGNVHFLINKIKIQGLGTGSAETFKKEVGGWYILAGSSRMHEIELPEGACENSITIGASVDTDRMDMNKVLDVAKTMCK